MTGRIVQAPPAAGDGENPAAGGTIRNPLSPLPLPPAEPLPPIKAGHKCSCWGGQAFAPGAARLRLDPHAPAGQGGLLGLGRPPCTPATCNPRCKACQAAGRPFLSHAELRFLDHGGGPLAAELEALWQAKDKPKAARHRRPDPKAVCVNGHLREPGRVGRGRGCKVCAAERRRASRAQARAEQLAEQAAGA